MATKQYGFGASTKRDDRYTTKREHPDKYESWWGTHGTQSSKRTWSVRHSTHPLIAWATEIKKLCVKIGTPDEHDAAVKVIEELKELAGQGRDFRGIKRWTLRIESVHQQFSASIQRL